MEWRQRRSLISDFEGLLKKSGGVHVISLGKGGSTTSDVCQYLKEYFPDGGSEVSELEKRYGVHCGSNQQHTNPNQSHFTKCPNGMYSNTGMAGCNVHHSQPVHQKPKADFVKCPSGLWSPTGPAGCHSSQHSHSNPDAGWLLMI